PTVLKAGVGASYKFDNTTLFDFHVFAKPGTTSVSDLDVMYSSVLGSAFDSAMRAAIMANLAVDPVTGTVTMNASLDLFPRAEFDYSAGTHSLSGGLGAEVDANVPEPATLVLSGIVAIILLGCASKKGTGVFLM